MTYDTTWRHFKPQLKALAEQIQDEVGGDLWEDTDDDCWGYHISLDKYDWKVELSDSEPYDGTKGQGNIGLAAVEQGGRILCDIHPFNFTPQVWVPLTPKGWPELEQRLIDIERELYYIIDDVQKAVAA